MQDHAAHAAQLAAVHGVLDQNPPLRRCGPFEQGARDGHHRAFATRGKRHDPFLRLPLPHTQKQRCALGRKLALDGVEHGLGGILFVARRRQPRRQRA